MIFVSYFTIGELILLLLPLMQSWSPLWDYPRMPLGCAIKGKQGWICCDESLTLSHSDGPNRAVCFWSISLFFTTFLLDLHFAVSKWSTNDNSPSSDSAEIGSNEVQSIFLRRGKRRISLSNRLEIWIITAAKQLYCKNKEFNQTKTYNTKVKNRNSKKNKKNKDI